MRAVFLGDAPTLLQPKTIFSIDLSKGDLRQLSLIFLPLLFLFCGFFAFSIADITIAIALPLATVSRFVPFSFVIQTLALAVGYIDDKRLPVPVFPTLTIFIILLVKALISSRNIFFQSFPFRMEDYHRIIASCVDYRGICLSSCRSGGSGRWQSCKRC